MLKHSEKYIQNKLIKFLKSQKNVWFVKTILTNQSGCPDILCCINGQFVAIELKSKGKLPSQLQMKNINEIREAKGSAYVFDDLELALETLKKDFKCI